MEKALEFLGHRKRRWRRQQLKNGRGEERRQACEEDATSYQNYGNVEISFKALNKKNTFCYDFFKAAWSVVEVEVVQAVKSFFITRKMLKEVNATIISLVPMKQPSAAKGDY